MKKKITKKLLLNKTTMTNLSAEEQLQLRGGIATETQGTGYGMCLCNATKRCSGGCVSVDIKCYYV